MIFHPIILEHNQRINWSQVTHIRLKFKDADTPNCQKIIDHIRANSNADGIATFKNVINDFPRIRKELDHLVASRQDLRHMANLREAGTNPENKGLIELGTLIEADENTTFAEQLISDAIWEGAKSRVTVNRYERDKKARELCLNHWGHSCAICEFNFEQKYGGRGVGFIHVHHLTPLSEVDEEYIVDPINDLCPVCPNCHAMIHRFKQTATILEIKALVVDSSEDRNKK